MTDYNSCDELSSSDFECLDKNDNTLYNTATKSDSELEQLIASWAIRHNITHSALDDLLISLSKCSQFNHLPKDSRTLLKTPTTPSVIKTIKGGIYHHFGIHREIELLTKHYQNLPTTLSLKVGIDGLPVTKNPPSQMWPILGYFSNLPIKNHNIFIIGAYRGKPKPEDCNEFLENFVNELCILINTGAMYNNKNVKILLEALIRDTPAKSFILNLKGNTAKNSCIRCLTVGEYENNRVYFPHLNSNLRTHDNFISYSDSNFHSGSTILTKVPQFDIINCIPFDYMHCVCIGIMKKLLMFWNGGVKRHKLALPNNLISVLDKRLNDICQYIPVEFQRTKC